MGHPDKLKKRAKSIWSAFQREEDKQKRGKLLKQYRQICQQYGEIRRWSKVIKI